MSARAEVIAAAVRLRRTLSARPRLAAPDAVMLAAAGALRPRRRAAGDDWQSVAEAIEWAEDDPELLRMDAILGRVLADHAEQSLQEIGVDVDFHEDTPELSEWLREKVIQFAKQTDETTVEAVRSGLLEGQAEGETVQQLAARVREAFDGRKANALTVARTETLGAANLGRQEAFEQAGLERQEWLSQRDDFVRESHQLLDGEVVEIGEPFSNGLLFPGDTDHGDPEDFINCRCSLYAVIPGVTTRALLRRERSRGIVWRAFSKRLAESERAVARQFRRMLSIQQARAIKALAEAAR